MLQYGALPTNYPELHGQTGGRLAVAVPHFALRALHG